MFDLDKIRRESGLSPHSLTLLEARIKDEFEGDPMMFELHFLSVVKAIKEGWVSLEEVLKEKVN